MKTTLISQVDCTVKYLARLGFFVCVFSNEIFFTQKKKSYLDVFSNNLAM